jgi:hypothetical protein
LANAIANRGPKRIISVMTGLVYNRQQRGAIVTSAKVRTVTRRASCLINRSSISLVSKQARCFGHLIILSTPAQKHSYDYCRYLGAFKIQIPHCYSPALAAFVAASR